MIKNIVFDIGNVLVRFQPDEAMREIGIEENKIEALAHATRKGFCSKGIRLFSRLD